MLAAGGAQPSSALAQDPASSAGTSAQPPLPIATKSPVALFRELLAMSPPERREALTNRPPQTRDRILAKLRDYTSMRPDERELRLKVTELRWYLLPLMSMSPTNRPAQLASLPADLRELAGDRLRMWDLLPPPLQKELLENEATIYFFTELNAVSEAQQSRLLQNMPPERRKQLETAIAKWNSMPETERRNIVLRFNQIFDLTEKERRKTLNTLSEAERAQMEKTLDRFQDLPPQQRSQAIRSFEKFATLSLEERQQFLKNAERWKLMTPDERTAWRDLVSKLALVPTLPVRRPPLPLPPAPRFPPAPSNHAAAGS